MHKTFFFASSLTFRCTATVVIVIQYSLANHINLQDAGTHYENKRSKVIEHTLPNGNFNKDTASSRDSFSDLILLYFHIYQIYFILHY